MDESEIKSMIWDLEKFERLSGTYDLCSTCHHERRSHRLVPGQKQVQKGKEIRGGCDYVVECDCEQFDGPD